METPKKYPINQVTNLVQEPTETLYKSTSENETEMHPILIKLIEQGKRELELGLGIPHEEVMRRVKLKYPFLK
jgi:hypothetical protein